MVGCFGASKTILPVGAYGNSKELQQFGCVQECQVSTSSVFLLPSPRCASELARPHLLWGTGKQHHAWLTQSITRQVHAETLLLSIVIILIRGYKMLGIIVFSIVMIIITGYKMLRIIA